MPITYQTEEIKIDIVGQKINLQQVTNVDEVFDDLISKDSCDEMVKDEQIPYWTEIWPSSIGLCMHLNTISEEINGSRVLELGCGLGLPSIYAGFLNPKSVKATDYLEDALTFCKRNWLLNHSSNIFETARFDWRSPNLIMKSYDVLLAADIVYEDRMVTSVFKFLEENLLSNQVFILSDPNRRASSKLFTNLEASGQFTISKFDYDVVWREVETNIKVYEIRRTEV
jgi:predicted nicotinamide N-methyase